MGVNFIFRGQREGEFRPEVDPFHFMLSLNAITLGFFTTAAMVRRLWNNMPRPDNLIHGQRQSIAGQTPSRRGWSGR
jgi:hypothetical protein